VLKSMLRSKVQEKIASFWPRKRVYMINGLKIAHPSPELNNQIEIGSKSNRSGEVFAEGSGEGAPIRNYFACCMRVGMSSI
jgi:hypothetical protein